jgi:DNA repair protein SbcC/Rad50
MLIKKFVMENFGRHKKVELNCQGNVVGLLGPNGAGKSTIFDGLEFAITGELRDPIDSYVRYGQGNASVSLTFVKNGQEGHVFRQFGKTPKRKLVWEGKPYTKSRDVDGQMANIFGADKKAIANAVFINQGSLSKILFSKDADRRDLFIRLVNMSFCEGVANTLDGKIKHLDSTISDLGPAIDAATEAFHQVGERHAATERELQNTIDNSAEIKYCQDFQAASDHCRHISAQIGQMDTDISIHDKKLAGLLEAWRMADYQSACDFMALKERELETKSSELTTWRSILGGLTHLERIDRTAGEKRNAMSGVVAKISQLNPENLTPGELQARVDDYDRRYQSAVQRDTAHQRLQELEKNYHELNAQLKATHVPAFTEKDLNNRVNELANARAMRERLEHFLKVRKNFSQCDSMRKIDAEQVSCVECGLTLAITEELTPEFLQDMADAIQRMQTDEGQKQLQLNEDTEQLRNYRAATVSLEISMANTRAETTRIQTSLEGMETGPAQELQTSRDRWLNVVTELRGLHVGLQGLTSEINRLNEEKNLYSHAAPYLDRRHQFTNDIELQKIQELDRLTLTLRQLKMDFSSMQESHNRLTVLRQQRQLRQQEWSKFKAICDIAAPERVQALMGKLQHSIEAVREELSALQEVRSQLKGRVDQLALEMMTAQRERQSLLTRQAGDVEKRKLIDDLKRVRDMMKPDGLPLDVVNYHFQRMASLTQDALARLGANFSIQIDPETPLSFTFLRLDEPSPEPLPMIKLSGGQRIGLCTAFLIAVQQRLVKEVGLLVLDEPSTHVDQAGVDNLADLLKTLATQLANTEIQVLVSDHHVGLRHSFDSVLELNG